MPTFLRVRERESRLQPTPFEAFLSPQQTTIATPPSPEWIWQLSLAMFGESFMCAALSHCRFTSLPPNQARFSNCGRNSMRPAYTSSTSSRRFSGALQYKRRDAESGECTIPQMDRYRSHTSFAEHPHLDSKVLRHFRSPQGGRRCETDARVCGSPEHCGQSGKR